MFYIRLTVIKAVMFSDLTNSCVYASLRSVLYPVESICDWLAQLSSEKQDTQRIFFPAAPNRTSLIWNNASLSSEGAIAVIYEILYISKSMFRPRLQIIYYYKDIDDHDKIFIHTLTGLTVSGGNSTKNLTHAL